MGRGYFGKQQEHQVFLFSLTNSKDTHIGAEGATNSSKKWRTSGTIKVYVWYYLLTSPNDVLYVQLLISG
jgi:hypothetical protein